MFSFEEIWVSKSAIPSIVFNLIFKGFREMRITYVKSLPFAWHDFSQKMLSKYREGMLISVSNQIDSEWFHCYVQIICTLFINFQREHFSMNKRRFDCVKKMKEDRATLNNAYCLYTGRNRPNISNVICNFSKGCIIWHIPGNRNWFEKNLISIRNFLS